MTTRNEFFADLAEVLKKHNVVLGATDDQKPHGMHLPLIEVDFVKNYENDCIELSVIDAESATALSESLIDYTPR